MKKMSLKMSGEITRLPEEDLAHVLRQANDILEKFRNSRVFITGGTGLFGMWLLEIFAYANRGQGLDIKATILTRDPAGFRLKAPHLAGNPAFRFTGGDVRDFRYPEGSFDYLFHFATDTSADLNRQDPLEMFDVIVGGTRHVLDFAAAAGIRQVLFASSGAVYGKQPPGMTHIPEDYRGGPDQLDTLSAYGEGKRAAEFLCSVYAQKTGMKIGIARCFALVGPLLPLEKHFAMGNFLKNVMDDGDIIIKSDGTPRRSYLYITDVMTWLLKILVSGENCRPYNVGSDHSVSILELAELVRKVAGKPSLNIEILSKTQDTNALEQYVPSNSRAREELKLEQTVGLEEAILKTIKYYLTCRGE